MPSQLVARSALALTLLLGGATIFLLANAVWFFAFGPTAVTTEQAKPNSASAASSHIDMKALLGANLFGIAAAIPTANSARPSGPLPVTRLALELLGIFQAEDPAHSGAVISEAHKEGEVYRIGDTLPGNAKLSSVEQDHVVIDRGGELETLRFDEDSKSSARFIPNTSNNGPVAADYTGEDTSFDAAFDAELQESGSDEGSEGAIEAEPNESQTDQSQQPVSSIRQSMEQYRDRLNQDPQSALRDVGLQPVADGAASGYRIGDGINTGDLARVGLQSGDVVLTVNGRPVGDVQSDRHQIDALMAAGSARLEIQRGNRRFFVTASLQ